MTELCFLPVRSGEGVERFVHAEQLVVVTRDGDLHFIDAHARHSTAVAHRAFAPRPLHEDAAHRFRRGREEVRAVLESAVPETQSRLVHECRRLERLPRWFARHFRGGEPAQFE